MAKLQDDLWDDLVAEFPPLWNPLDLSYRDLAVRAQCRRLLLEKCNLMSSIPITMESLMRKLRYVNKRRNRRFRASQGCSKNTQLTPASQMAEPTSTNSESTPVNDRLHLRELVDEYPCLWDPQNINYMNAALKTECEEQLLVKYNDLSSTPITMLQLRQKLQRLRTTMSRRQGRTENQADERRPHARILRLDELATEFPCLWDPKDPNYRRRSVKDQCMKQLLDKYNSLSSVRINYLQLRSKILLMRRRGKKRAALAPTGEDSRGDWLSDLGTSSDSTDPVARIQQNVQSQTNLNMTQTAVLSIVFHCCAVCGEVKSECLNRTDKPYIENNRTTLTINSLSVDLNFDKDTTVCQNCDMKLTEMYEFIKLVKNAQDKINGVNIADEMAVDNDCVENEEQKFVIDSLTVTDTELVKPTISHKRKNEETPESKKKCRVTIDLNSCDDDKTTMDDIAKYQMFNKDVPCAKSKEADKLLNAIVTVDGENINFNVKQEIETDDIQEEVNEIEEISTDDDKNNILNENKHGSENVKKEIEPGKIVTEEEKRNDIYETGIIVTKGDKQNDIVNDHINNSEAINEAASIGSVLASKEPMCVIPKSELVLLVESIVSRMLNK